MLLVICSSSQSPPLTSCFAICHLSRCSPSSCSHHSLTLTLPSPSPCLVVLNVNTHNRKGGSLARQTRMLLNVQQKLVRLYTPPKIQVELDLVEVDARGLQHFIDNEVVDANIGSWVPNPGSYQARATLYSKTMDLCWILKTLMDNQDL
jgi:hypothetical protein